jgi:exonuclease SbcC
VRLDHLSIHDFLGHHHTDIDFRSKPLVAVTGPVGSGKSSIIDAFTWCMWGEARNPGRQFDPLIREGSDSCMVKAVVSHEGREFHIKRNRTKGGTSSLTFEEHVEEGRIPLTQHTLGETQTEIERTFGIDWQGLTAGPIALQGAAGLMTMQPRQRKAVLQTMLVGDIWDHWYERAHDGMKLRSVEKQRLAALIAGLPLDTALAAELDGLDQSIRHDMAQLADEHSRLREAQESISLTREDLATAKAAGQEAVLLREQADETHRRYEEQGELDVAYTQRVADGQAHLARLEEKKVGEKYNDADHQQAKAKMTNKMSEATTLGQRLAELRVAVSHAGEEVTCPNCQHTFHPGAADYHSLVAQRDRAEERFAVAQNEVKKAQEHEREVRDSIERHRMWQKEWDNGTANLARFKEHAEESHTRLLQLKQDGVRLDSRLRTLQPQMEAVEAIQQRLAGFQRDEKDAQERVASWQRSVNTMENERREKAGQLDRLHTANNDYEKAGAEYLIYEAVAEAFHPNGIPTLMLESTLPRIEDHANEALAKMPGDMRLTIRTQKVSKEGTASETLDVIVTIGDTERGYDMLSGGQKFRVDLALRLALTRVLSSQQIDTLVVDEGFDRFQDPEGREAIMETLMAVADGFSRIIVVSHHPDVIERFGQRLEVSMEDGISHVH